MYLLLLLPLVKPGFKSELRNNQPNVKARFGENQLLSKDVDKIARDHSRTNVKVCTRHSRSLLLCNTHSTELRLKKVLSSEVFRLWCLSTMCGLLC